MRNISFIKVFIFAILLSSCSKFQRIVKSEKWQVRYDAALAYYEKGDYFRAGALLEDLVPILAGNIEAEKARFYLAYCYFKQGQYVMSAEKFNQFHDTYNRSEFAEEALYMSAYSQYMDSPIITLDQGNTDTAIDAFQEFINRYPSSKYAQQAGGMILELRAKLEEKAYNLGRLYQKLVGYRYEYSKAAVISYENFRKDFPDSKLQEQTAFHKIEAQYELAENSYFAKQKERYEEVLNLHQAFVEKYPKSTYLKKVESIVESSQRKISSLTNQQKKMSAPTSAN